MRCVLCRYGETKPGTGTVTLERGSTTLVFKGVPASVCTNCDERYYDEEVTAHLLALAAEAVQAGVHVDVREYRAEQTLERATARQLSNGLREVPAMLQLVDTVEEVLSNIWTYQTAVRLCPTVVFPSQVRDWYYVPGVGVGPSRFIGYKEMTCEKYEYHKKRNVKARGKTKPKPGEYIDGGETERHIHQKGWFRKLTLGEPSYKQAYDLAKKLAGTGVRNGAKFYIRK
ncbi:MAG: type II toxin-antitoxin system MqsA family antitoxin [Chloroflexi bacterium]|nr:type II toxin-antitoxin system MqsA family antitoxin [Chloroflexota bacterium]